MPRNTKPSKLLSPKPGDQRLGSPKLPNPKTREPQHQQTPKPQNCPREPRPCEGSPPCQVDPVHPGTCLFNVETFLALWMLRVHKYLSGVSLFSPALGRFFGFRGLGKVGFCGVGEVVEASQVQSRSAQKAKDGVKPPNCCRK